MQLPQNDWQHLLQSEFEKPYFQNLEKFITSEYEQHIIYPPKNQIFRALQLTEYKATNVLILGQDPYHGKGQAEGLAFSVPHGVALPPSLRNMLKEREDDVHIPIVPQHGSLENWAKQGILLLNTVLTVREGQANSHQKQGWETFTDAIISVLNKKEEPIIFVLWGKPAQTKKRLISPHHIIIESAHPSPLSAYRGFLGSAPYSKINNCLVSLQKQPIDWTN